MTNEIELAFAHPEERSKATADRPLDRLSVHNHTVEVEIGAFQSERDVTQRLSFNIVVEIARLPADLDDDVDRILSYDRLTEAITTELASERLNLLETLCDRIALRILTEPQAERVFVRIEKLDRGPGALGVEVVRRKVDLRAAQADAVAETDTVVAAPVVAYLSHAALHSAHVEDWITQLAKRSDPVVICVPPSPAAEREGMAAGPRRRMALLSAELAAWQLCDSVPACVVVGSRTEMDWAFKNGQVSIWAPSRIVLDAPEGGDVNADDGFALAVWFAQQFAAVELLAIGTETHEAPAAGNVPLRCVTLETAKL